MARGLNLSGVLTPSGFITAHPLAVTRFSIDKEVPAAAAQFGVPVPHRIEPLQFPQAKKS